MPTINLPNLDLRPYQVNVWKALEAGARRVAPIWPRRAGKDTVSMGFECTAAHEVKCNIWHLFPEQTQARKAIWNGINKDGERIIDKAFPRELRENTLDNEMLIKFKSGSTWQLGGSDRYDALVGSNPRIVTFSEYSISDPRAYDFVRPILAENGGQAIFPFTPRGRNHGYDLYQKLKADPLSFAELLTCDDTGHMSAEALALERAEMSEEMFLQEYYGSFDFGIEGSYYALQMNRAETEGRIAHNVYDESLPVWVGGDIGLHDSTALWFVQIDRAGCPRWIDYLECSGKQVKWIFDAIVDKGYTLAGPMIVPHDAKHTRLGMPQSVADQFRALGMPCHVLKQTSTLQADIEDVRVIINRSVFDRAKTERGRSCLSAYRREKDEKRNVLKESPLHDWSSDGADGYRYMVSALNMGYIHAGKQWAEPDYSALDRAAI